MICQRCNGMRGEPAVAIIRSDILNLKVCRHCALEAAVLGLRVEPIDGRRLEAEPTTQVAAA